MNYKKNFVEINKKIASNNGLKNNLKDCLLDLKKDELKVYTDNYQIKGISKLKKSDLVDKIYEEVIINKKIIIPIESIEYSAFLTLETLIKEQTIDITNASVKEYIDLYSLAIAFPYIVEDKVMLVMPTEVATTFADVDLTKTKALLSVQREFKDYVKSFGQVYGAIELDMFVDYFNNATGDVITKENITSYFDSLNNNVEYMGIKDNMLVHEAILMYEGDLEKLLKERTNKGIKTYKELAKDDLLKYANDDYIEMSKDHEKFIELMTDLIEDENEAFDTLFELKTFFTCNEYNVNIVADILFKHIGEEKLKNQKVLETLVKTSFNIFENTRRWGNSGFTTAEIRPSKEPITSVKVAGRNEPCPCGSGKKYKKCCLNK